MIGGSEWKDHRSTDKRYSGDNADTAQRVHIDGGVWHPSMSAHHILGLKSVPKDMAVRHLKWYASWVPERRGEQFGPLSAKWALDD